MRKSDCVTLGECKVTCCYTYQTKNSLNSQSAFCTQSAVCIFYLFCILNAVCSLHFVLTGLVLLFLFERASSPDRNNGARKKIFRPSWPLWLMCWLYVEELPRTSTMIEQWLLYTNWRRTQMHGLPARLPLMLMLFCVVTACFEMNPLRVPYCRCEHFDFSIQVAFLEVQKGDFRLLLFLNHKNMLFLSTWVSELHRN